MLYRENALGRSGLWQRLAARVAMFGGNRRAADQDVVSLSAHLRRDVGLIDGECGFTAVSVWRR